MKESQTPQAFGKVNDAARYSGVSHRTIRTWLTMGLPYSKMPTGVILIKLADIDSFIQKHQVSRNQVDEIVESIMKDL
jgi:hypothetical protein